jgi:5-methylcytosine-specific restriction endonuclease McrA
VVFGESLSIEINPYEQYLRSAQWKARRAQALDRAGDCCQKCGVSKWSRQLEVHHLTYARLGEELPQDLIVLCSECHSSTHLEWAVLKTVRQKREYVEANWKELNEQARGLWGDGWWMNETQMSVIEKLVSMQGARRD